LNINNVGCTSDDRSGKENIDKEVGDYLSWRITMMQKCYVLFIIDILSNIPLSPHFFLVDCCYKF